MNNGIDIAVDDVMDAAQSASNIILTKPGLSVFMGTMFTNCADYGKGEREALATMQRMLHGLNQATSNSNFFDGN